MYLDGLGMVSIANRLTDRGYRKDTTFSSHFVKGVLDTPVYMVKIAYDRRRTEKVRDRMNAQIAPSELESELKGLEVTRRQTNARIRKISEQMDALDALDDMYDRKGDMQDSLDAAYKDLSRVRKASGASTPSSRTRFAGRLRCLMPCRRQAACSASGQATASRSGRKYSGST